eukprot:TRINITY_DN3055_c0_g2_i5.p1 TRINITY_DN3055_c0_g2~~TRINITY_DN3055_c0_g2_i5.p1  ORF type:complete len:512 (-),score=162.05 TRINITY_DN3055_c0_g2_i5:433-1968(-)
MTLTEAWQTYLRQRAALWLEGVLVLRTWLTDPVVLKKCKCNKRLEPDLFIENKILKVAQQGESAGVSPRTNGLAQEIVKGMRCKDMLWRTHSYGAEADLNVGYIDFCWRDLDWALLDDFILFKKTQCALGDYTGTPVNDCIKCLSTAASLGRLPTCASSCLQLTKAELRILSNRCGNVIELSESDSPVAAEHPTQDVRAMLVPSLSVLLDTCRNGMAQWQVSRAEVLLRGMDRGRRTDFVESTVNSINTKATFMYHALRYHNMGAPLIPYLATLKVQQCPFQRFNRNNLTAYLSIKIRDQRMVAMGRLPEQQNAGALYAAMMTAMMEGTWSVFEKAAASHLQDMGRSFADFESLDNPNSLINILINNNRPKTTTSCAHLQVPWAHELAAKLLDGGFTIADVCRLELLAHLYVTVHSPVRPQALFDNKASMVFAVIMAGTGGTKLARLCQCIDKAGHKKLGAIATEVPLPSDMTRMYLMVLFVFRQMRAIKFGTVPDFCIGFRPDSNERVKP